MGLFTKKFCDICGNKIKFLEDEELKDGTICWDCMEKLSQWIPDTEELTISEVKKQIEARKDLQRAVHDFTYTYEYETEVNGIRFLLNEDTGEFMLTDTEDDDMEEVLPDLFQLDQVTGCEPEMYFLDEDEEGAEEDAEEFYCCMCLRIILSGHPYLDEICFNLSEDNIYVDNCSIDAFDPEDYEDCIPCMELAGELMDLLGFGEETDGEDTEDSMKSEESDVFRGIEYDICEDEDGREIRVTTCPWCGSKVKLTYECRCENCGGKLNL